MKQLILDAATLGMVALVSGAAGVAGGFYLGVVGLTCPGDPETPQIEASEPLEVCTLDRAYTTGASKAAYCAEFMPESNRNPEQR